MHKPFQSGVSVSYHPLALPDINLPGPQSQSFGAGGGGLTFLGQVPQAEVPNGGGLNSLLLREGLCDCDIPPACGSPHWGWGGVLERLHLCLSYPSGWAFWGSFVMEELFSRSFLRKLFYV